MNRMYNWSTARENTRFNEENILKVSTCEKNGFLEKYVKNYFAKC